MSAIENPEVVVAEGSGGSPSLTAHHCAGRPRLEIVPARRWREWMDETEYRWANRCLPLLMANESGWWILNRHAFTATWRGGDGQGAVSIEYDEDIPANERLANSDFGYGILTFGIPYVISTERGWDLLARGPANLPRDGISPLEGLVETDWSPTTFTMNWKFTRVGASARFEAGDPFCMLVPQRRHDLERVVPRACELEENADLLAAHMEWGRRRHELAVLKFVREFGRVEDVTADSWQKDYFKGRTMDGGEVADHRTKRRLRTFD
jgi:Family of unknown function (DUF6065)